VSGAENEFRSGLVEIIEIDIVQIRYHRAFAGTDRRHVNPEAVRSKTELFASAKV
jgi:hypothetical protein